MFWFAIFRVATRATLNMATHYISYIKTISLIIKCLNVIRPNNETFKNKHLSAIIATIKQTT